MLFKFNAQISSFAHTPPWTCHLIYINPLCLLCHIFFSCFQTPMSNSVNPLGSASGNGSFRVQQQQHHSLHQTQVTVNGGIVGSNSIYDSYYENLVELNKLNQAEQTSSQTADSLQGYYSDSTGGLQSPGSAGIPDIILTGWTIWPF